VSEATLKPQTPGIPVPKPSSTSAPYWDATAKHELVFQRCDNCGTIALRPTTLCGNCLGRTLSWVQSSGRGRLYSWTVVWRPQHPSFTVPYAPAIVALDEGWYMMSAVIGCEPGDLRADMPLVVEFHPAGDEISLPYFRPTSA
jgi:uncharacterized OB-fold protein